MAVYGPAQDDFKTAFLAKLVRTCQHNSLPTLIGGDFNILCHSKEKNNNRFNYRWPFLFNAVIDSFDLREIELTGRQFTWVNSLSRQTFEKLDRVLMTTEWEFKFPLVSVQALDGGMSDHTPLLFDSGTTAFSGISKQFRFELSWFSREDFHDKVVQIWSKPARGNNLVQCWNHKIGNLCRFLRGWSRHTNGVYKQKKAELLSTINELDIIAEGRDLSQSEQEHLAQARDHLANILREEEMKYYQ